MRSHGTLKTWNEARAFGFIAPSGGGPDVFVHMSSMPRDGLRPRLGEVLIDQAPVREARPPTYQCDGRIHCAQMSSCAEATWVLEHCPHTRMDGDRDGIPCESQWCT